MKDAASAELRPKLPMAVRAKLPHRIKIIGIGPRESRGLNRRFFRKNIPANVLSFRYGSDYGEILVCPAAVHREAREQGNTYKYQMTWMILHGMLHLAGVHHEKSVSEAKKTDRIERQILGRIVRRN